MYLAESCQVICRSKDGSKTKVLRSILIEGDLIATEVLEGFSPCETCKGYCQKACPVKAFPEGKYNRPICREHVNANVENKVPIS